METETKTMVVQELKLVTAQIAAIHQKMDYLATVTPGERARKRGTRVGPVKLDLLKNRVAAARANPGLLPAVFDLAKLERDTEFCFALAELLTVLGRVWDGVSDTLLLIGEPAFVTAATAHAHIKVASETAQRLAPTELRTKGRSLVTSSTAAAPAPTGEPSIPVTLPAPVTPFNPGREAA